MKAFFCGLLACVVPGILGCSPMERIASPERINRATGIIPYPIRVPEPKAEAILQQLDEAIQQNDSPQINTIIDAILAKPFPSNIAAMTSLCAIWARAHPDDAAKIAKRLIEQTEVAARWAGIQIAEDAGLSALVRENLQANVGSLLIRPDPVPWWVESWFRRMDRAGYVADLRAQIIELAGQYRVTAAAPILHIIMRDSSEWYPRTKEAASQALAAIEGSASP